MAEPAEPEARSMAVEYAQQFLGSKAADKIKEQIKAAPPAPAATPPATPPAPVVATVTPAATVAPPPAATAAAPGAPAAEAAVADPGDEQEEDISPLVDLKPTRAPVSYKTIEEYNAAVKSRFDIDDPATLLASAKKWKDDSAKLGDVQKQYDNLSSAWGQIPEEIRIAGVKALKGENYRDYLKNEVNGIDYTLDVDKQDVMSLIKEFSPETNFTRPEGDDYIDITDTKNPALQAVKKLAIKQYSINQASIKAERIRISQTQEAVAKSVLESISTSVESFATSYQKIDKATLKSVEKILSSDDVEGALLRDKNGKYRADAALRVYMAEHGVDEVKKIATAYSKLKTQYEELLGRGDATRKGKNNVDESIKPIVSPIATQFLGKKTNAYVQKGH